MRSNDPTEKNPAKQGDKDAYLVYYPPDIFYLSPSFNKVTGLLCSDIVHKLQLLPNVSYCPRVNPESSSGTYSRNRQRVFLRFNHPIVKVKVVGLITFSGSFGSFEPFNKYVIDDGSQARLVLVDRRAARPENLLPVGCVVKAKGFISEWNQERQLEIVTLKILPSFTDEIVQWESIVHSRQALQTPWIPNNCHVQGIQDFQLYYNVLRKNRYTLSKGQHLQANGIRQVKVLNFQSASTYKPTPSYRFANDNEVEEEEEEEKDLSRPFGVLSIPKDYTPTLRGFKNFLLTYFSECGICAFKLSFLLGTSRDVTPLDNISEPTDSEYKHNIGVLLRAARQTIESKEQSTSPKYNEYAITLLLGKVLKRLVKEGNLFMPCTSKQCASSKGRCHCSLGKRFHNKDPSFQVVGRWNIGESIQRYLDRVKRIYLQQRNNSDNKGNNNEGSSNESNFCVTLRATTIWKSLLTEQPSWSTLQKGIVMDVTRQLIRDDSTALWKEEPTASGTWNLYGINPM